MVCQNIYSITKFIDLYFAHQSDGKNYWQVINARDFRKNDNLNNITILIKILIFSRKSHLKYNLFLLNEIIISLLNYSVSLQLNLKISK